MSALLIMSLALAAAGVVVSEMLVRRIRKYARLQRLYRERIPMWGVKASSVKIYRLSDAFAVICLYPSAIPGSETEIVVKSFRFDKDNNEDMEYALRCAEELKDKLDEEI